MHSKMVQSNNKLSKVVKSTVSKNRILTQFFPDLKSLLGVSFFKKFVTNTWVPYMFIQLKSVVGNNKSFPWMYMLKKPNGGKYFILKSNQSITIRLPSGLLLLKSPLTYTRSRSTGTVAKFIVPDWEDKVAAGIGLSYRPARIHRLAGQYGNPSRRQLYPPVRAYEFGYWYLVTS